MKTLVSRSRVAYYQRQRLISWVSSRLLPHSPPPPRKKKKDAQSGHAPRVQPASKLFRFRSWPSGFRLSVLGVTMSEPRPLLRILCLAGFRQSERGFREKTGSLRKALRGRAELLYLSGPHPIPEPAASAGPCPPEEEPRGWWFSEPEAAAFSALEEPAKCRGLEEALEVVGQAMARYGPLDGLLGFSQGAALAALVCALGQAGDPRFPLPRFVILVSGFRPRGPEVTLPFQQAPLLLPSLHVLGETDKVIPTQESLQLATCFSGPVTLSHPGGHFIPAAAPQRQVYLKFLDQFIK
ncbi:esterase OVCA2 [Dromiciops gliroides]|uniref:esterase OVCA2 n=1 Tax=Dromiciops gliroides TaxID=33562 RepID=UPI001CC5B819|nr:esterase OVCA2 [Dromiciops gliroides]